MIHSIAFALFMAGLALYALSHLRKPPPSRRHPLSVPWHSWLARSHLLRSASMASFAISNVVYEFTREDFFLRLLNTITAAICLMALNANLKCRVGHYQAINELHRIYREKASNDL